MAKDTQQVSTLHRPGDLPYKLTWDGGSWGADPGAESFYDKFELTCGQWE